MLFIPFQHTRFFLSFVPRISWELLLYQLISIGPFGARRALFFLPILETMRSFASTAQGLAALALVRTAAAAEFPRAVAGDGFLSIPVGYLDRPHADKAVSRRDFIEADLFNKETYYTVDST